MQHQSSRRNHHGLFAYAIFALCGAAAAGCTDNLGGVEHDGGGGSTSTGDTTDGVSGGADGGTGGSSGGGFDEADIVGCLQDPENRVPCAFEGLADPAAWSVDPVTMLRYRRVTSKEREANGWPASAYLVEATPHLSAVEAGADVLPPYRFLWPTTRFEWWPSGAWARRWDRLTWPYATAKPSSKIPYSCATYPNPTNFPTPS